MAIGGRGDLLTAWSTAMSGRLEPQVERAVSVRYYKAVTRVEVEATERPEIQRVLEAGRFGTDSARSMLRLSVGVGNVFIGMVAAAVVLVVPALDPAADAAGHRPSQGMGRGPLRSPRVHLAA